eukprot:3341825-Pleurochrysis_carterae.AAC.3
MREGAGATCSVSASIATCEADGRKERGSRHSFLTKLGERRRGHAYSTTCTLEVEHVSAQLPASVRVRVCVCWRNHKNRT